MNCKTIIKVAAFIRTQDEISRLIESKDYKGELLKITIKPKMFTYDGEQIRIKFLSKGFVFVGNSFSKRKLIEYISSSVPSKEATLISRCGFHENVYIRPDCVIGTEISDIILDDSLQDKTIKSSSSLKDWNDGIAQYCECNSRLIFAVSAAFASVLLKSCEIPNFGFHFVGNSSSGKTTSLNVAASVFGNQDYVVSWKTTDNALENTAIKRNDALLILDELSEVSPIKAGDIAYMLANGQGKRRLDKNCNARETLFWRLIFLSSGEVDLNSHMSEANKAYDDFDVIKRITKLQSQAEKELRKVWYSMFDREPEIMSRKYMIAKLAYRIQELAYGGVDAETEEKIKAAAKKVSMPHAPKKQKKFEPMIGTKIVKEYRGKVHEVLVTNDGFSYYGETYKSLSAIATKITGTKWNGLKFFNVAK